MLSSKNRSITTVLNAIEVVLQYETIATKEQEFLSLVKEALWSKLQSSDLESLAYDVLNRNSLVYQRLAKETEIRDRVAKLYGPI